MGVCHLRNVFGGVLKGCCRSSFGMSVVVSVDVDIRLVGN